MSVFETVEKRYDVVVVGGGLSGMCAAIAAARHGANTALIQNRSVLGGNASSEIRMHVVGAGCHNGKKNLNETGLLLELLLENKRRNRFHAFPVWDGILWEKARYQEGLTTYLNTTLEEVVMDGQRVRQIVCRQQTTELCYRFDAAIFVDATGNATLGKLAGADFHMGSECKADYGEPNAPDEPNTDTMGCTLMFQAVNRGEPVPFECPKWAYHFTEDDLKYRTHVDLVNALGENGAPTEFSAGEMKALPQFSTMDAGYWWIELGGQYDDIIRDAEDIRDELLKCVYGVWDHIKNQADHGAANFDLEWVGMVPGYRESRRLMGDYVLTENDIRENRVFPDAVAYGGWPMDEHVRCGILDFDKYPSCILNFDGAYTIPYRCYYARNIDNLMMAGRDISASKMAFGSLRVMGTCAVGGQAVGTAAALAVRHGLTPRALGEQRISELIQLLLKDDCYIPGFANEDPLDLARACAVSATSFAPGCPPENVLNGVARTVGECENCWQSLPLDGKPQRLTLSLPEARVLREVRLTFDPNLSREIMPSLTSIVRDRQVKYLPEELVKDCEVTLWRGETPVFAQSIEGNGQRLNVLAVPDVLCDRVTLDVLSTHGFPAARVYEVRLY